MKSVIMTATSLNMQLWFALRLREYLVNFQSVWNCVITWLSIFFYSGCTTNEIRLNTFGQDKTEGRLQICRNRVWGNVCSRELDQAIAVVTCKELGLNATGNNYIEYIIGNTAQASKVRRILEIKNPGPSWDLNLLAVLYYEGPGYCFFFF